MLVKFEKYTGASLYHVVKNMRKADVDEIKAYSGDDPVTALSRAVKMSDFVTVPTINGEPFAVFGMVRHNLLGKEGVPWLLGTNLIKKHPKEYMKAAKLVIAEMEKICPQLINYVHTKNKSSVVFLKGLGFKIHPAQPVGIDGEMFHLFTKGYE